MVNIGTLTPVLVSNVNSINPEHLSTQTRVFPATRPALREHSMKFIPAPQRLHAPWLASRPPIQLIRNGRTLGGVPRNSEKDSPAPEPEEPDYKAAAQLLNKLFYSPTADDSQPDASANQGGGPQEPDASQMLCEAGVIPDLPLWRIQCAALPGFQELLHVHVPHYCDMFVCVLAQPRPWRFGYLYLPDGSSNLGNPDFAMHPGTQAPLVGTVMEILQAVKFEDGRLLLLAVGVGRFKVVSPRQTVPHSRADVALLPDWEEVQLYQEHALHALDAEPAEGEELSVAAAMQASMVAAEQAAGAAAREWWRYEVAAAAATARTAVRRPVGGDPLLATASADDVIISSSEEETRAFGKLLVSVANTPVAALPSGAGVALEEEGGWGSDSEGEGEEAGEGEGGSAAGDDGEKRRELVGAERGSDGRAEGGAGALQGSGGPQQAQQRGAAALFCAECSLAAEAAAGRAAAQVMHRLRSSHNRGCSSSSSTVNSDISGSPTGGSVEGAMSAERFQGQPGWGEFLAGSTDAESALLPGLSLMHASAGALSGVNSCAERGVEAPLPISPQQGSQPEGVGEGTGSVEGRSGGDDVAEGGDVWVDEVIPSRSVALRLEAMTWRELDAVRQLAGRLKGRDVPLQEGLAQLRPPHGADHTHQRQSNSSGASTPRPSAAPTPESALSLHSSYPSLRRAQRLSYALASVLGDVSPSEGRQALLEAPSVSARLQLCLSALRRHRAVLAAVVAVQGLSGETS